MYLDRVVYNKQNIQQATELAKYTIETTLGCRCNVTHESSLKYKAHSIISPHPPSPIQFCQIGLHYIMHGGRGELQKSPLSKVAIVPLSKGKSSRTSLLWPVPDKLLLQVSVTWAMRSGFGRKIELSGHHYCQICPFLRSICSYTAPSLPYSDPPTHHYLIPPSLADVQMSASSQ